MTEEQKATEKLIKKETGRVCRRGTFFFFFFLVKAAYCKSQKGTLSVNGMLSKEEKKT